MVAKCGYIPKLLLLKHMSYYNKRQQAKMSCHWFDFGTLTQEIIENGAINEDLELEMCSF